MWEKNTRTVMLRPRIPCDIEPREPEILGRRQGETDPGRRANCDGTIIRLLRVQRAGREEWVERRKTGGLECVPNCLHCTAAQLPPQPT